MPQHGTRRDQTMLGGPRLQYGAIVRPGADWK